MDDAICTESPSHVTKFSTNIYISYEKMHKKKKKVTKTTKSVTKASGKTPSLKLLTIKRLTT